MEGILRAQKFEKKADTNLGDDQNKWESQIVEELIKSHTFLADKMQNIEIEEIDSDNNRHIGSISVIIKPGTSIEIPIMINDGVLLPIDMFAYEKNLYPLSEDVVGEIIKTNLDVGKIDNRPGNLNSFADYAVADNTEPSEIKLSKMLDLVGADKLKEQINAFGKYEKLAMEDFYSLFNDKLELKDKNRKVAMQKEASKKEAKEWVGYAYKTDVPYTFDVVMYKRSMITEGEMLRKQRMTAEEMENSNIHIYDAGHINIKIASTYDQCTPIDGSTLKVRTENIHGKPVYISTDVGLTKAIIMPATDPMGKKTGEDVFISQDNISWGIVDKSPHMQKSVLDSIYVWPGATVLKDLEDIVGKNIIIGTADFFAKGKDLKNSQKYVGPFNVSSITRYNKLGDFENAVILDVRDVNGVRSRLVIVNVAEPAEIDQESVKFRENYGKLTCDRDIYLMPGSYAYCQLGPKIKIVSKETYDLTKKAVLENRSDKHVTIYNNRSYWDVIVQDDDHIKKLSFLTDNEFDTVCREELGKYANELEIPMLSKREYFVWEI